MQRKIQLYNVLRPSCLHNLAQPRLLLIGQVAHAAVIFLPVARGSGRIARRGPVCRNEQNIVTVPSLNDAMGDWLGTSLLGTCSLPGPSPDRSASTGPCTEDRQWDAESEARQHVLRERQNLTMRMSMRRFTRLTNAFSKKLENHAAMLALYFMYYNFGRVHLTLRVTPAMEAGIADHVWSIEEIVGLIR